MTSHRPPSPADRSTTRVAATTRVATRVAATTRVADTAPAAVGSRWSRPAGRRLLRLCAAGLGLLALWACGPVYIPVPPPGQISFTAAALTDATGATHSLWITSGGPNGNAADATFFVIDQERDAGVIARARPDGSFTAGAMEGAIGDHVTVYYRDVTGRDSVAACVLLSTAAVADRCP